MHEGERFNVCSHLAAFVLALAGALVTGSAVLGDGNRLKSAGALVFAVSVLVLYGASALFHASRGPAKAFWQRVDHASIYLLIAATCTAFSLGAAPDAWDQAALVGIWGMAAFGVRREFRVREDAAPSLALYVAMGWIGVAVALRAATHLSVTGVALLIGGAAIYSAGTVFYRNRRGARHAHGVWHLFVMGGTACHYAAIALP